jgi:hypothetical protein
MVALSPARHPDGASRSPVSTSIDDGPGPNPSRAPCGGLDHDALARPQGRATLGETLELLTWHESDHVGQATLYRRGTGLPIAVG